MIQHITARIGRMAEGNIFSLSVHTWEGGVPQSQVISQVTFPRSFLEGGTPVWCALPPARTGLCCIPPSQDRTGVAPGQAWMGYFLPLQGYPQPGQDWGILLARSGWGTLWPGQDWGTPPPARSGCGTPNYDWGTPLGQNNRASTC